MKNPDRFEKTIDLRAPRRRVWQAISTPEEFGTWFGLGDPLELEGRFEPGAKITGTWIVEGKRVTEPFCTIERVEPEQLLVFSWVPYEVPPGEDHAKHPTTRIEMRLEEIPIGTRLTISESGFAALPADKQYKRDQNATGWDVQGRAIASHLLGRIEVKVEATIAKPLAEVLEAIVDPAKMSQYFLSRGSGRMEAGAKLEWEWSDVGAKLEVDVVAVESRRVFFVWKATGLPTKVTLALEPDGDRTKIIATEAPFPLTEEAAAKAIGQTQGWTEFCCCLKAYLQHGIDLRRGKRVA
jgi:uncharacterized protein YndB with AHSA1/START domain